MDAITPAQTVEVTANGVRFNVLVRGQGPLVLLLHGFPDTAHTWDHAASALAAAGFCAAAPFMRGYAPTTIPADGKYDTDTLGQDALALITALGHSQAIVVGHDWGAGAAYCAAGLGPSALRFLVTVAIPHPAGVLPTPQLVWSVRHFLSLRLPGAAQKIRAGNLAHLRSCGNAGLRRGTSRPLRHNTPPPRCWGKVILRPHWATTAAWNWAFRMG